MPGIERPLVHRHVHHRAVRPEDVLGAVAVMRIPVDDEHAFAAVAQRRGGHRDVVEQAEAHRAGRRRRGARAAAPRRTRRPPGRLRARRPQPDPSPRRAAPLPTTRGSPRCPRRSGRHPRHRTARADRGTAGRAHAPSRHASPRAGPVARARRVRRPRRALRAPRAAEPVARGGRGRRHAPRSGDRGPRGAPGEASQRPGKRSCRRYAFGVEGAQSAVVPVPRGRRSGGGVARPARRRVPRTPRLRDAVAAHAAAPARALCTTPSTRRCSRTRSDRARACR